MKLASLFLLSLAPLGQAGSPDYFSPMHRVSGIGVARDDLSTDIIDLRTDLMIQSQTFAIMREPLAVPGAKRITSPKLQSLFRSAADSSGFPEETLEAIAYLESWGDPKAESYAGPKGIMQIAAATAREMGLRVVLATRYKVTRDRVQVIGKAKKPRYKTITHRVPYVVTVRDDRLFPERAVPAAARYLAGLERHFGGRDWAIFAYHCGAGCVAEMQDLTKRARGIPTDQVSVARMFFSANPAWNRELYQAIQQQMQRDWSPTYFFRVKRAEQLLALYRSDPVEFESLSQSYKSDFYSNIRAPHRLSVWLKRDDMVFHSCDDIRAAGARLVKALDRPQFFGYRLNVPADTPGDLPYFSEASPAALGTLTYIAFETRRLFEELKPRGETFQPLTVSSLVQPQDFPRQAMAREGNMHCSGQVFDIDYSTLPPGELECLRFVLEDLGWDGYLGFVEEGADNIHIGCSPESRDFFAGIFQEALGKKLLDEAGLETRAGQ
jgi:soluble lytic murein transglycosylase-like protein